MSSDAVYRWQGCGGFFFFSSRRRHTRCALVTGVQTCALPICPPEARFPDRYGADYSLRSIDRSAPGRGGWEARPGSRMVGRAPGGPATRRRTAHPCRRPPEETWPCALLRYGHRIDGGRRSEEHTSELQSLMRISYAVFCLKK